MTTIHYSYFAVKISIFLSNKSIYFSCLFAWVVIQITLDYLHKCFSLHCCVIAILQDHWDLTLVNKLQLALSVFHYFFTQNRIPANILHLLLHCTYHSDFPVFLACFQQIQIHDFVCFYPYWFQLGGDFFCLLKRDLIILTLLLIHNHSINFIFVCHNNFLKLTISFNMKDCNYPRCPSL